ncbi:uncharacterized protein LOC114527631 [Dendronephthya gigantea]|uniref:uncharacterized protein LOC114527631 n=1 Tax=Dendronephthya gigantea TaxID=151771 RepID=UPI00106C4939|nr:uncharacterized protein LOC114527631 [Dendronephthya gigantea]
MVENSLISLFSKGFQIDISEKHSNWLTVGELICSIQKPIAIYVDAVVKDLHEKLCEDLCSVPDCRNSQDCNKKTRSKDLCDSCNQWYTKVTVAHKKGKNPSWHKNCDCTKWPQDYWEVAKFFMSTLGSNKDTVKDAQSTDLSSLLNVLEWMKDEAFLGKNRVKVDFVRKLRNEVRNIWAHAPRQEMTDEEKDRSLAIANDILEDLVPIFPKKELIEVKNCQKHLESLKSSGITTNIIESVLRSLVLQRRLLDTIKEEITQMGDERASDKTTMEEHERKLKKLEVALKECSQRKSDFENLKTDMNKQFKIFQKQLKSFSAIPEDIRAVYESLRDRQREEQNLKSSLQNRMPKFTGRETEIKDVISLLIDERKIVVSLHGGPGFGKSAIATEVSHILSDNHDITVFYSELNTATTVDEMIRQLCSDVGVNYERNDPKSSLVLWLKFVQAKVIFIMDGVDNLLEDKNRVHFDNFIKLIGKNQNCQVITTSRMDYFIPEFLFGAVHVKEMDDKACIELLEKRCYQDDKSRQRLAKLCGNIPLAMSIAASQVNCFEESKEFWNHLEKEPVETLKDPMSNQYVDRAIRYSYDRLNDGQKRNIVRLAVFDGNFSEEAAGDVIENDKFITQIILEDLFRMSLIKKPTKHRYSIHVLIQHFLKNQLKGEKERKERARAEVLMIKHYLKLGHDQTKKTYSKDGYKPNRDALKNEAHHIQKVLKICYKQDVSSDILDCLAESEIYNNSAKFFALLARTIIPRNIVQNFLELCAQLAEEREQQAIKINFDCLLAGQARRETIGRSDEDYESKMEKLQEQFEANEDLKQDKPLYAHYLYHQGRYLTHQAENLEDEARLERQIQGRENMEKSLKLRNMLNNAPEGIADKAFALLHVGNACKIISKTESFLKKMAQSESSSKQAQEHYEEAIQLSEDKLGDHELTAACYKSLGDLFLRINHPEKAKENYTRAKEMRENLGLDASKRHVSLLNKLGISLTKLKQADEAIELLENARMMAEELADSDEPTFCKSKVYASLASAYNAKQKYCEDAVSYAKKAMEFDGMEESLGNYYKELREIADSEMMDTTD